MKKLKIGTFLIVLGNVLYLVSMSLMDSNSNSFGDFSSGF